MALKNVNIGYGGAASAPHFKGDGTTGQTYRRLALGATGARIDIHTYVAGPTPEGVVLVAADAVGALCVVRHAGVVSLWGNGNPGQSTGWEMVAGGGGAFTDLGDVPDAYTGAAGFLVRVTGAEDGLEFVDGDDLYDALGAAEAVANDLATHNADTAAHPTLLRSTAITRDIHWALDSGNDANDGTAGNPVQTQARVRELSADSVMFREACHVRVIMDEVSASSYELWDVAIIGEGLGRLSFEAADDTYEVVDAGPYTVGSVTQYAVNAEITVSPSPSWTDNEHMGCWVRYLTGSLAGGQIHKVGKNGAATIDTVSYVPPSPGDTFEIVQPAVLATGPGGGVWQPLALGTDAGSDSARLRVLGLRFPDEGVYAQGSIMFGACKLDGYLWWKSHSSGSFYDYDTGAYLDIDCAELGFDEFVQLRYGSATCVEPPTVQAHSHVYLEYLGWSAATFASDLMWNSVLNLGSWYGRGAGGFVVQDGAQLIWDSFGARSLCDVQSTGETPLHVYRGGRATLRQSSSTDTTWPTLKRLVSGVSVRVESGGELVTDPGRFWRDIGRGGVDTDIVVGSRSLARSALYDGVNNTRAAHVLDPTGAEIRQVGGDSTNNQVRAYAPFLPANSSPGASDLVVTADATTGLERATPVSALGLTASQVMALNYFGW